MVKLVALNRSVFFSASVLCIHGVSEDWPFALISVPSCVVIMMQRNSMGKGKNTKGLPSMGDLLVR